MYKNSILAFNNKESIPDVLNALLREGAQQLIHRAVESELSEYLSQHQHFTADGRIAVVRNGYLPKREILTGIGPVSVRIPRYSQEMESQSLSVLHWFRLTSEKRDP